MNLGGLSPEKAPPVEAPLTLFYLMPLFLVLAGMLLTCYGGQVLESRWTPAALAATHFLVLGALAPVMCGSLLQISPVLLGAPFPLAQLVAALTATGLGLGGLAIGLGFLFSLSELLLLGAIAVCAGLAVFLIASYRALAALRSRSATLWTVRLAVVSLAVTIVLGVMLALARSGWVVLDNHLHWVHTHVAWGLAGWVGLLLAGIGMEVIPMFYVSPAFPRLAKRMIPPVIFGLLILLALFGLFPGQPPVRHFVAALFATHLAYNLTALYVEGRRRRPQRDANLWLWQISHAAVLAAGAAWLIGAPDALLGVLLLGSALTFVVGTLTKVVPFLSWLDLQQRRIRSGKHRVKLPHMQTLLPAARANAIASTLVGAIVLALAGMLAAPLAQTGGVLLQLCGVLLAWALFKAARLRQAIRSQFEGPGADGQV